MKNSIIALSILFSSLSFAATPSDKVESIPICGKGQVEIFAAVKEVEFPKSTVVLSADIVAGIKGYLKAGLVPAICQSGKAVVFASR